MEEFRYTYNTATAIPKRAHTGVVGSGDAEILMEPSHIGEVFIKTNVEGFQKKRGKKSCNGSCLLTMYVHPYTFMTLVQRLALLDFV
ncbi:hypothetical protein JCM19055_3670 [Geomicrobium sp. JCM 19055]|nr:hypothetical protein JCM19055_3670 [Geomicrobium sp. JCM 19055]